MLLEMRICSAARGLSKQGEIVGFLSWEFWKDVTLQEEAGCIRILKTSEPNFARLADVFVLRDQFNKYFPAPSGPRSIPMAPLRPAATVVPYLDPDEPGISRTWKAIRRFVAKEYSDGFKDVPTAVIRDRAFRDPEFSKKVSKDLSLATFNRALLRRRK